MIFWTAERGESGAPSERLQAFRLLTSISWTTHSEEEPGRCLNHSPAEKGRFQLVTWEAAAGVSAGTLCCPREQGLSKPIHWGGGFPHWGEAPEGYWWHWRSPQRPGPILRATERWNGCLPAFLTTTPEAPRWQQFFFFFFLVLQCSPWWRWTHCVAYSGLKLTEILLPQPSECWDYMYHHRSQLIKLLKMLTHTLNKNIHSK